MRRATATLLFTDLVGSTELRGRLGEEAADDLRRKHDDVLTKAVEANSGRVVKGLGDGIMATFTGASDAVAAAVAMQQGIDRLNRSGKTPAPLAVRVGLSAGDVTFEDDDVHGTPVIEASRLCAAVQGGEIFVSEVIRLLAGLAGDAVTDRGRLELKGLAEPVPAWEVRWEPAAASSIPMTALLTDVGRIFVGRDTELERLTQLWKEVAAGERRVALLAGEPGVGKTRLAAELAMRVHEEGGVVLAGRCDEDLGVPYQPFVEALRHFIDHSPPADLGDRLGRYAGELTRLLPELPRVVPRLPPPLRSDPETEQYRLFDAIGAWLGAASADQPLLLVLDDLQWAAKPTLLLLRHVARATESRILILGTYRDTELAHDHPLGNVVRDLRRQVGAERLSLTGLDDVGVAVFVEKALGRTVDEVPLAQLIYQETEGNPFFVREVLRHLTETGALEQREGGWAARLPVDELGIPEGVRDVIGRRLSRLSDDTKQTLRVAGVAGAEFDLGLVRIASGFDEERLLAALEEACAARLVLEGSSGRYRFSHALVRATLYDELTAARRVSLHRRVAEAIETCHEGVLDDQLPALAHHWARATAPADTVRAVEYATRAGDRALGQLAHDEAVNYYRQALELLQDGDDPQSGGQRLDLLISLGEAQRRAGDPRHRETLLDGVRHAKLQRNRPALVRAALANSRGALSSATGTVDVERVAALHDALDAVGDADPSTRARILANLALELTWSDRKQRVQLSDEALTLARNSGDPATLAEVLVARYYAIAAPDTLSERLADTAELLPLVTQSVDSVAHSRALALRFRVAMECGDVTEAGRCLEANERLTGDLAQPALSWLVAVQRVGFDLLAGRIDDAERHAAYALDLGQSTGQPDASFMFLGHLSAIRFEQGRLGEVVDRLTQLPSPFANIPVSSSLLALAFAETGQSEKARAALEILAGSQFTGIPFDALWLRAVTDCAVVCGELGDSDRAAVLQPLLVPYGNQFPVFSIGTASGCVSHYLGVLATTIADFGAAEARFIAAEAVHARIGAPAWLARTRLEWARMLLRRGNAGDIERARQLLGQALATARELGLATVERRAVELLT